MSYIDPSVYVIGSIAYDDLETPSGSRNDLLGGSAVYFSIAGSIFSKIGIIGTVGNDFNEKEIFLLNQKNIDTSKIEKKKEGSTFRWKGNYSKDFEDPITISTSLGVFEEFSPKIDKQVEDSSYIFLANISPDIQHDIANNLTNINKIVGLDTMNHWIIEMKESLLRVMNNVDIFFLSIKVKLFCFQTKKVFKNQLNISLRMAQNYVSLKTVRMVRIYIRLKGKSFIAPHTILIK